MNTRGLVPAIWTGIGIGILYVMAIGRDILMPLALAVLLWYILDAAASMIASRVPGGARMPRWLRLSIVFLLAVGLLAESLHLISLSLEGLTEAAPIYQENLLRLVHKAMSSLGSKNTPGLSALLERFGIESAVSAMASAMASMAGNTALVLIYVLFLFMEQESFGKKMVALFPRRHSREEVVELLDNIQGSIRSYIWIKTGMALLASLGSLAVLALFGVDYSMFWAFVVFLLYYMPTVGPMVGVVFPSLLALVQFPDPVTGLMVAGCLAVIQFGVGNILEPKLLGGKLNISMLVVLLSLALWGKVWGVMGMFLCVPLTVIVMIIFAHFPTTRAIAIALSENGCLEDICVYGPPEDK